MENPLDVGIRKPDEPENPPEDNSTPPALDKQASSKGPALSGKQASMKDTNKNAKEPPPDKNAPAANAVVAPVRAGVFPSIEECNVLQQIPCLR